MAVSVVTSPAFSVTGRRALFSAADYGANVFAARYAPDLRDERFLMVRRGDVNTATEVIVVVNWLEELRERVR